MRQWYRIDAKADPAVADVYIYDQIGPSFWNDNAVTAASFINDLKALPDAVKTIRVHVNSPGGSVFDATAIANAIRAQETDHSRKVEMRIDGLAASAATIVTSAADKVAIAKNAMVMIHEPASIAMGPSSTMRKMAETLDSVRDSIVAGYQRLSKKSAEDLVAMMSKTTWMTAQQAIDNGFATEMYEAAAVTACFRPDVITALGEIPAEHRAAVEALIAQPKEEIKPVAATAEQVIAACKDGGCTLEFAQSLITAKLTAEDVATRVTAERERRTREQARTDEIKATCKRLVLEPDIENQVLASAMPIDQARVHLASIAAVKDRAKNVDSKLDPATGTRGSAPPVDINAQYARLNGTKPKE